MKRSIAVVAVAVMLALPLLMTAEAWARAGGGGSSGSRGSRSYSAPARTTPAPSAPSPAPSPYQQTQRPGWGGALGGLLLGGLIGSLLFGGYGGGFGGIGFLEILLIGGLAYVALSFMRRRAAAPPGYATPPAYGGGRSQGSSQEAMATVEAPAGPSDLERGIAHIRQMDPAFDPARFTETAEDIFFKIQAAWVGRDMRPAAGLLTDEMRGTMQTDCDRLRVDGKINRLENIAVREAQVTEAWQEQGQDWITVHFLASLLDYTTDESGARVLEGSRTEPVKFEEYWTFVRPVGRNPWRLTALQQPG